MNNRIERIDAITLAVVSRFSEMSVAQLSTKPSPDRWSIAEILRHIIQVNESYLPTIESLKAGTYAPPFLAKWGWFVRVIGKEILKSVHPSNRRKTKTMRIWEPRRGKEDSSVIDDFKAHQEQLKRWLEELQVYADAGQVISSPANVNIVYTLATAMDIIVTHEERHLMQAIETARELKAN